MKVKILSLLLSVTLFFFAAVPARAATDYEDGQLMDVLDYANANESELNSIGFYGTGSLNYTLPTLMTISYVDIVFQCWGSAAAELQSVTLLRQGSALTTLTVKHVSGYIYRAYGTFTTRAFNTIGLQFDTSDSSLIKYASIQSFKVGVYTSTSLDVDAYCSITSDSYTGSIHYVPTDTINSRSWLNDSSYDESHFDLYIYCPDWTKFDYIDYNIFCDVSDITSIHCEYEGNIIPIEVGYLDNTSMSSGGYSISVRIDLSNIDRSSNDGYGPILWIDGVLHVNLTNFIGVSYVVGHVRYTAQNPVIYWFKKVFTTLDSGVDRIVDAIKGDDTQVDEDFDRNAAEKNEELDYMVGIMDTVQRPDINKLDPVTQLNNSGADIAGGIGPVLTVTMQNPIILQVLILSLTFAMIAYVLYGKR